MNKIIETIKTIVITALAIGIIAFVLGVRYQANVVKSFARTAPVVTTPAVTVSK